MESFWKQTNKPLFLLAPMEAVTDVIFRHVVIKAGAPDLFMTEFTNATGWAHAGDKAIGGRLVKTDDETNLIAQLWGSDPKSMELLAKHCQELGFKGIDINMGCPDASAIKGGGGAQMIRTPQIAFDIIKAAKESGLPVSVKTRLGFSFTTEFPEWFKSLLEQDIAALTVHLRTKKEMSKVPAHFELIDEISQLRNDVSPKTPLVINGDIKNRQHGLELAKKHDIDGVMIGRGIFADPFCFNPEPQTKKREALIDLLQYHLDLYDEYSPLTNRPFETLKRFFKIYIRDFNGASELRDNMMHAKSTDEVRNLLSNFNFMD